jgi:hypothetical protein
VSIGISINKIRQYKKSTTKHNKPQPALDMNTSIAALPAGGYFANEVRACSEAPEQAEQEPEKHKEDKDSSDSDSSSSSSSDSEKKRRKKDIYCEKAKKPEKELKQLQLRTKLIT